ncbi:hypothetical protein CN091_29220, partial [Sinorhizobium meliloti]
GRHHLGIRGRLFLGIGGRDHFGIRGRIASEFALFPRQQGLHGMGALVGNRSDGRCGRRDPRDDLGHDRSNAGPYRRTG